MPVKRYRPSDAALGCARWLPVSEKLDGNAAKAARALHAYQAFLV